MGLGTILSIFFTAAASVARTLVVVALGGASARLMKNSEATNSLLSTLNVYIFLPALFLGHFSTGVNADILVEGIPLMAVAIGRIIVGSICAKTGELLGIFSPEDTPLAMLAVTSSNAVAIPLAVLGELEHHIPFLTNSPINSVLVDGRPVAASKYVVVLDFVYAVFVNLAIWAIGNSFIARAAAERDKRSTAVEQTKKDGESVSLVDQMKHIWSEYIVRMLSVPFVACISGVAIGVSYHRELTGGSAIPTAVASGVMLIGVSAVPGALIPLGITIANTLAAAASASPSSSPASSPPVPEIESCGGGGGEVQEQQQQQEQQKSVMERLTDLLGVSAHLVISICALQLVFIPLIVFIAVRIIYAHDFQVIAENPTGEGLDLEAFKRRRLMLFALLLEAPCPSPINTSIVCTLHKYRDGEFGRIIVVQYILAIFTLSFWLSVNLWFFTP